MPKEEDISQAISILGNTKDLAKVSVSSISGGKTSAYMALKYPITIDEMINVHGVGEGKAKKYGKEFVELIKELGGNIINTIKEEDLKYGKIKYQIKLNY